MLISAIGNCQDTISNCHDTISTCNDTILKLNVLDSFIDGVISREDWKRQNSTGISRNSLQKLESRSDKELRIAGNKLRKRPDGGWELRKAINGEKKSFYGLTQKIVLEKYKAWLTENKPKTKKVKKEPITLEKWVNQWLITYKKPKIKESTFVSLTGICNRYIIKSLGNKSLGSIKNIDCQEFLNSLAHMGNTKNKVQIYLNEIFKVAVKNNLIKTNPAQDLTVNKSISESGNALTDKEMEILENYEFENYPKLRYVFLFILYTGCRRSEALGFDHVTDIKDDTIHLKGTKTFKSDRYIPYFDSLKELFKDCPNINFNDISPDLLTRKIKEALPNHTVKDLRTSFATKCHEAGIAPKVVQKWMGHTNIGTTMNIYTKVNSDFEKSEADKLKTKK
ncbi:MAG: tyrosine-type recombinase/integrase [Bacillota bacterium]